MLTVPNAFAPASAVGQSLCRYFAVALASRRITVNVLSPGFAEDIFVSTLVDDTQATLRSLHESGWTPMGRLAKPEDIVNAAALLCSAEANWITGQVITVDGGASLMNSDFH